MLPAPPRMRTAWPPMASRSSASRAARSGAKRESFRPTATGSSEDNMVDISTLWRLRNGRWRAQLEAAEPADGLLQVLRGREPERVGRLGIAAVDDPRRRGD